MYDFVFKSFEDMTPEDYASIGFKSGLEIHQQLYTRRKLFCRCPAGRYSTTCHAEILRHMRPTLSELGVYDGTALMEFKTRKEIIYRVNKETVCTYEMDDTPPFMIDEEALDIALEIAMLAELSLVDELHIARKQYLDGSIPTGFQRTTICGVNGSVPYGDRSIGIIQLGLEEDSCREISDIGHRRVYNTDRLGMPLIELVTAPDMKTPQEVAEVANLLRKMMRTTQHVRRGAGATRADTNASVEGGTRVEIKGVPKISLMPLLTYNEARRQYRLLQLREELHRRGITPDTFTADVHDATRLLRKTRFSPINQAVAAGRTVRVVRLAGWLGLLRWETQLETFFSREISDRVRVIACLTTLPNIIHSDSPSESISGAEWRELRKLCGAAHEDTLVVVWGDEKDVETASQEIIIRAKEATEGVPSETRQALRDGTTGFERILPGADRMYPDTDLPPLRIAEERVVRIASRLPVQYWNRKKQYKELGVPADCIEGLSISPFAPLFDEAITTYGLSPQKAAILLYRHARRLRREGYPERAYCLEDVRALIQALASGALTEDAMLHGLRCCATGTFRAEDLPPRMHAEELPPLIAEAVVAVKTAGMRDPRHLTTLVLDTVMDKVRGRIPGAEVAALVAREVKA